MAVLNALQSVIMFARVIFISVMQLIRGAVLLKMLGLFFSWLHFLLISIIYTPSPWLLHAAARGGIQMWNINGRNQINCSSRSTLNSNMIFTDPSGFLWFLGFLSAETLGVCSPRVQLNWLKPRGREEKKHSRAVHKSAGLSGSFMSPDGSTWTRGRVHISGTIWRLIKVWRWTRG